VGASHGAAVCIGPLYTDEEPERTRTVVPDVDFGRDRSDALKWLRADGMNADAARSGPRSPGRRTDALRWVYTSSKTTA